MKKKKLLERGVLVAAVVLAVAAIFVSKALYDRYQDIKHPNSMVYGTWVEQGVAPYSADSFVLNETGVVIDGGVVNTRYRFNGSYVEFQVGEEKRRYQILNQGFSQMRLISEPHYQPIYQLSEKSKNNIR
ncbi:DUF2850 domain-containing protein [Vibrio coralliilyticus]|uniref:DUF2850 domain-containing protein n=1 Tax=Vibrio coralliilyticus TaxID=190893 RepID=A0AAN0S9C4_9VIBR|nr:MULTISPECIES: DUF2850 domain-containing protein [Vibrio]AIW18009.1 hypothetical protein IX92_02720 [Vibrio coralliilyticus]NOH37148.1 DUF2850 domain-containing protein [Vibrio coralliilyticus]NOH62256.1 DUF2850 domain-containing protein [Vibrio sp. RE88]